MDEETKSLSTKEFLQALREEHKSIKEEQKTYQKIQSKLQRQRNRYEQKKLKPGVSTDDLQQLREKFTSALTKLNNTDTRDVAIKEIRYLIEKNASKEALRMYLSSLSEHRKGRSPNSREQEVALIGYISQVYGDKLLEPGPNPLKTLIRMAEITQVYFKDLKREVHVAAGNSLCDIYKHAFPKESKEIVLNYMLEPLNCILASGIDVKAQQAAAYTVFKWTEVLIEENNIELLHIVYDRTIVLFTKLRAEFPDLISALGRMSEKCGFEVILNNMIGVLSKLILYVKSQGATTHIYKIEACKMLTYIGKQMNTLKNIDLGNIHKEVIDSLERVKGDKLPAVQKSVREALNEWNIIGESAKERREKSVEREVSPEEITEAKRLVEHLPRHKSMPNKISPPRNAPVLNQFRAIRDMVKIQKEKNTQKEEGNTAWGINKPKFLEKRTGQYAFSLGNGQVDLNSIMSRPSIRDLVKNKLDGTKSSVELYYKEPIQLNHVLLARETEFHGQQELQYQDSLSDKETELNKEQEMIDKENLKEEFIIVKTSGEFAPPPSVNNLLLRNEDIGSPKGITRIELKDSYESSSPLIQKNIAKDFKPSESSNQVKSHTSIPLLKPKNHEPATKSSLEDLNPNPMPITQQPAHLLEPILESSTVKTSKSSLDDQIPTPIEKPRHEMKLPVPYSDFQVKLKSESETKYEVPRRLITSEDNPLLTNSGIDREFIAKELLNKILHPEHNPSDDISQEQARDLLNHLQQVQSESREPQKLESSSKLNIIKEESPIRPIVVKTSFDQLSDQTPKLSMRSEPLQGFRTDSCRSDSTPKRQDSSNSFSIPSPRFKSVEPLRPTHPNPLPYESSEVSYLSTRTPHPHNSEFEYAPRSHIAPPQKYPKDDITTVFIEKLKYEIMTGCERIDRGLEDKFIEMDYKLGDLDDRLGCAYDWVGTLYDLQNYKKTLKYSKVGMATQTTDRKQNLAISIQTDLKQPSKCTSIQIQTDSFSTQTPMIIQTDSKFTNTQIQTDFHSSNEIGIMTDSLSKPSLTLSIPLTKEIQVDSQPTSTSKLDRFDSLTQTWINALKELSLGNIDQAYSLVLESGDDIYLLRLMLKTGTCLGYLSQNNSLMIMKKLSMILNSFFMENLGMMWFTEHISAFKELGKEEKVGIMECLNRLCFIECQEATKAQQILSYLRNF